MNNTTLRAKANKWTSQHPTDERFSTTVMIKTRACLDHTIPQADIQTETFNISVSYGTELSKNLYTAHVNPYLTSLLM